MSRCQGNECCSPSCPREEEHTALVSKFFDYLPGCFDCCRLRNDAIAGRASRCASSRSFIASVMPDAWIKPGHSAAAFSATAFRILFSDVLVNLSGKQDTLRPFASLNEAFHTDLPDVRCCPFDVSS